MPTVRISALQSTITEMQVEAIMEAALDVAYEGVAVFPEIMLPGLCSAHELNSILPLIQSTAQKVNR